MSEDTTTETDAVELSDDELDEVSGGHKHHQGHNISAQQRAYQAGVKKLHHPHPQYPLGGGE